MDAAAEAKFASLGLTFDDVLLIPERSEVTPAEVDLRSRLTRRLDLAIPFLSAAMDTVTESRLAIAMACAGGLGVVHRNMAIDHQEAEVDRVKRTVVPDVAADPLISRDPRGRLLVGAAVGVGTDAHARAEALVRAEVDVLVIDTAHGHARAVMHMLEWLKTKWPDLDVIAGNVATTVATADLINAGADAIKVGMGPGSICTTRVVSGVGMPQMTAIYDCWSVACAQDVPVIADGGLRYSGDITKAIAAGADACMLGNLLAGAEESPGDVVTVGETRFKRYRGMGSLPALRQFARDRYGLDANTPAQKLVPEGVEAMVPYKGPLAPIILQLTGGLRAGMGYVGARTVAELKTRRFVRITPAGMRESHAHSVTIAPPAPTAEGVS